MRISSWMILPLHILLTVPTVRLIAVHTALKEYRRHNSSCFSSPSRQNRSFLALRSLSFVHMQVAPSTPFPHSDPYF